MLFTIAIPTYNSAHCVSKAIDSALNQNYENEYEVLIVNNASTDNTDEIIKKYSDNRIRIIENQRTVDLFENHNVCLEQAKGDYVLFIHSDDALRPYALSILSLEIKRRCFPQKFIIWGESLFRDSYHMYLRCKHPINTIISGASAHQTFIWGGLTPSGTCYSRKSILSIGGFDKMNYRITPSDWSIMQKAAFNGFEFEMLDRLLFERNDASTALRNLSWKEIVNAENDAFITLSKTITPSQRHYIIEILDRFGPIECYPSIKQFLSLKRKIRFFLKNLLKSHFRFHIVLKYILYRVPEIKKN